MRTLKMKRTLEFSFLIEVHNKARRDIYIRDDFVEYFTIKVLSEKSSSLKVYVVLLKKGKQDFSK